MLRFLVPFACAALSFAKPLLGPRGVPWDENDASLYYKAVPRPAPGGEMREHNGEQLMRDACKCSFFFVVCLVRSHTCLPSSWAV